jgi:hypothetical protein
MAGPLPWEEYQQVPAVVPQQPPAQAEEPGPWDDYQQMPVTDLPAVNALPPDFSGVTTSIDSTASGRQADGWKSGQLRDLMFGVRSVLQGAGGLFGALGGDAINQAVVNPIARKIGVQEARPYREELGYLADRLGLPSPQNATERVYGDIGEALTGTGLTLGAGGLLNAGRSVLPTVARAAPAPQVTAGLGQRAGEFLTAQPGLQVASTIGGTGASGAARESGAGTGGQLAAALAGGLAPSALTAGVPMAVRGAIRGGEANRQNLSQAIDDFAVLGATPSVGQGTGAWSRQGAETLLGAGPTSAGVMARFADRQAEAIGAGLQQQADSLFRNPSAERAGRAIEQGIRGEDGFIRTSRERANQLYDRLDALMPADQRVGVENTRSALADLNSMIEGAPSVSRFFQNARLEGIERGLLSDTQGVDAILTQPGMREQADLYRAYLQSQADDIAAQNARRKQLGLMGEEPVPSAADIESNVRATLGNMVDNSLPYEALKKLRTLVGNELEGTSLVADVPRSKWKAVYGALSRDMEAAASSPEARQALERANRYFNARATRIDDIDRVIDRNGGPEKIYQAVMGGVKDGGSTLRSVMQSLPEEGQKAVTAAALRRMGLANPGAQDAAGETFSAATFLTNWNKASPEARRALFDRYGPGFSSDLDKVAKVAERIKEGGQAIANPSGTARQGAQFAYWGGLGGALMTGQVGAALGLGLGGVGSNIGARLMTNPRFVKWLAAATEKPVGALPAQINVLKRLASESGDPEIAEAVQALSQSGEQPEAEPN